MAYRASGNGTHGATEMPYNSETETFYQAPATVVDSTPDGDTVQEGFDDRLTPAISGIYADINLLKADGMIGVGIPATTTARGIGRVAESTDLVDGATINNGPAFLAAGVHTSVAAAAGKIPVADADGSLNSWTSNRFATCDTAANIAAKAVSLSRLQLANNPKIFITFSNPNSVYGPITLNVNSTGDKPVYNERGVISASNPAAWMTGVPIEFVYDGTNWRYKTVDAVGNAISQYCYVRDEKTSGASGGSTSSMAWNTRDLNTIKVNRIGASLASNRVTLPAGRYYIKAIAPCFAGMHTRLGLYNVTTSTMLFIGPTGRTNSGSAHIVETRVEGEFTFAASTTLELRMYTASGNTYGMGYPESPIAGIGEVYSEFWAWKM